MQTAAGWRGLCIIETNQIVSSSENTRGQDLVLFSCWGQEREAVKDNVEISGNKQCLCLLLHSEPVDNKILVIGSWKSEHQPLNSENRFKNIASVRGQWGRSRPGRQTSWRSCTQGSSGMG